ncbi:hypothetical protein D0812_22160 [Vibrio owensii]|uniref:Uncharacterized protein n=1 Tax=Vibrio owensii TaxID=696485 RepID=A0AAP9KC45_9VIBR|nr:DUF6682 family protein [Vibrio owensii]AYO17096.1 hypothetical protein D0812_22160 [Vibrio owensii]QGH49241.1 hypothetical protein APZ19_19170 [Vibrio owensii]
MANTPVSNLINQAARLVVDKNMIRWDKAFWVDAYNAAIRAVLAVRPDALTKTEEVICDAGTTQKIPANARYVIDVLTNVGGGAVSGPLSLKMFNDYRPEWRQSSESDSVSTWLYDERNKETFFVYPGVKAGVKIEAVFAYEPTDITQADYEADVLGQLNPMYDNAIIEWLVYRAFSEDSEITANNAKAQTAINTFRLLLGDKTNGDNANYARNQEENNQMR